MSNARTLIDLRADPRGVEVIREGFHNLDKNLTKAIRRAVWQTSRRIKKEIDEAFIRVSHVKASVIKGRLFLKFKTSQSRDGGYYSSVWVGLNPISLSKLNPVKQASGVRAGPIFVPSGFMPRGKFGNTVFRRRYESQRLPWDKQFYRFDVDLMKELTQTVMPKIEAIFRDQFQKEVVGLFHERELRSASRQRERKARA
jgi:hypothetical protein